jgi:hypothetical protein
VPAVFSEELILCAWRTVPDVAVLNLIELHGIPVFNQYGEVELCAEKSSSLTPMCVVVQTARSLAYNFARMVLGAFVRKQHSFPPGYLTLN